MNFFFNLKMTALSLKVTSRYSKILNLTFRTFFVESTSSSQNRSLKAKFKICNKILNQDVQAHKRSFSVDPTLSGSAARAETTSTTHGLNKLQAQELILRLNSEERTILYTALQEYQSKLIKDEYQGKKYNIFVVKLYNTTYK